MKYKEVRECIIENNWEFFIIEDALESIKSKEKKMGELIVNQQKELFKRDFIKENNNGKINKTKCSK